MENRIGELETFENCLKYTLRQEIEYKDECERCNPCFVSIPREVKYQIKSKFHFSNVCDFETIHF